VKNGGNHTGNVVAGVLLGVLTGGSLGLGACVFIFDEPPFFVGDTVLLGAVICGALGYLLGEDFIDWLKANWWHLW
jgi:hypothetical protein